jgi:hypothetical protein
MSYKTEELTRLLPDAYATDDAESLLYKLLDTAGAELMVADEKLKALLKSHWVDHASGPALDGLGAIFGVERRELQIGGLEDDDQFRLRLKAVVPLFTGGGTVKAVLGAVRSALGLPFDLDQLNLPRAQAALREDIEKLVTLTEFSPSSERLVENAVSETGGASELLMVVEVSTVSEDIPRVEWTFLTGGGRLLSLERLDKGTGVKSDEALVVPRSGILVLSADEHGRLIATIGAEDVSELFTNLDGTTPALLPEVPPHRSEWRFRAQSGLYGIGEFDGDDTYDLPSYQVEMSFTRHERLTFDVQVPYFLKNSVDALRERHDYDRDLFVFQGLPHQRIQEVVDQTRAAGVRGNVIFTLDFYETHDQREERCATLAVHRASENMAADDALTLGSINREAEDQDMEEVFVIGGVWDVAAFDGSFSFQ